MGKQNLFSVQIWLHKVENIIKHQLFTLREGFCIRFRLNNFSGTTFEYNLREN